MDIFCRFINPILLPLFVLSLATVDIQISLANQENSDLIQSRTIWKGKIQQGAEIFPATIFIQARNGDRLKGEIHFGAMSNPNKLTFQGNVIDSKTVVWITDKKEGNVTFPGLYIGKINGSSIKGVWQVPSANQYDLFSVKLAN
jgi:hypothetical protein